MIAQLPKLDEKSVLEHARVVSQSFRTATVLPFRFGTIFDTEDAIRQAVRSNRRTFCESVARLRGKSEMRIKLVVRDGSMRGAMEEIVLPDTVGREYLTKLREKASRERERQTKARALSVQVHKLFNPLEEEVSCKKVDADGMLLDIAHLIDTNPSKNTRIAIAPLQAAEELPDGRDWTVAAVPLPARKGTHRRWRQLDAFDNYTGAPFPGGFTFVGGGSFAPSGRG